MWFELLRRARDLSVSEWRDLLRAHIALLRAYRRVRRREAGLAPREESAREVRPRPQTGGTEEDEKRLGAQRAKELALAVERSIEYGPFRFHCLVQALALRRMLEEEGIGRRGVVRVGVRTDGRGFAAHAWVEFDGQPLREPPRRIESYTRLPGLDIFPEA